LDATQKARPDDAPLKAKTLNGGNICETMFCGTVASRRGEAGRKPLFYRPAR
jgi:hypothetical protein